jgi:hypothetical protein
MLKIIKAPGPAVVALIIAAASAVAAPSPAQPAPPQSLLKAAEAFARSPDTNRMAEGENLSRELPRCPLTYEKDVGSHGAIPLKGTHLLCGTASNAGLGENIAAYWGRNMIKSKQSIRVAWSNAGSQQYHEAAARSITNTVIFRVTGYPECIDDTAAVNTAPTSPSPSPGNLVKRDQQVYP